MDELNTLKGRYMTLLVVGIFFGIGGVLLAILSAYNNHVNLFYFMIVIGCGSGVVTVSYAKKKLKEISNEFKLRFVKPEIEKLIPGAEFILNDEISQNTVEKSHLVKTHEIYKTEDLIKGKIRDVDFRCADVLVRDIRSNGKSTTVVTTFQGRFYEFDFYKDFKSNLFLLQPGQYRPFSGKRKIKMESLKFNSEFKIYTDDEHDAFYILTPQLMERLLVLDRKYRDKIGFSFLNSKLYIAIDNREDTFDVDGPGAITNKDIHKAVNEIENLIEFVEFLKLNTTIFKQN